MRLLLDTHVYLSVLTDNRKLTNRARKLIHEADEVFISSASIWEAAIKIGLGKLDADISQLVSEIVPCGFQELPVRAAHAMLVCNLPPIHNDPFDRLLVAQAISEPLQLLTMDKHLSAYSELVIAV